MCSSVPLCSKVQVLTVIGLDTERTVILSKLSIRASAF